MVTGYHFQHPSSTPPGLYQEVRRLSKKFRTHSLRISIAAKPDPLSGHLHSGRHYTDATRC